MTDKSQPLFIDLVCCVDSTCSMASKEIRQLIKCMMGCEAKADGFLLSHLPPQSQVRYRLLTFRDYRSSGNRDTCELSPYMNKPKELGGEIDKIEFASGGDKPESTLEAIFLAMYSLSLSDDHGNSRPVSQVRHVIAVFTDNVPFKPEGNKNRSRIRSKEYPSSMPKTLKDWKALWNHGNTEVLPGYYPGCARLVIFAPFTNYPRQSSIVNWHQVVEGMDRTWFVPTDYYQDFPVFSDEDIPQAREMILAEHPDQCMKE